MNTGTLLRALANGVNPDTGELLRPASAACAPEAIRLLFALADEFDGESELQKKARLTPEEKRQKNLAEGRPANAYFPWPEEEKLRLRESHAAGATLEALSDEFECSTWSIAVQLQKMGLIGECKHTGFSSRHVLKFPGFQSLADILPVSGHAGIHEAAHCCIHLASTPLFPVFHPMF